MIVGLTPKESQRCLKIGKFPLPVCILLALADQSLVYHQTGFGGVPVMPMHELATKE